MVTIHVGQVLYNFLELGGIADDRIQLITELVTCQLTQEGGMAEDQAKWGSKLMGRDRDKVRFEPFQFRQLDLGGAHLSLKSHILHGLSSKSCQRFQNR